MAFGPAEPIGSSNVDQAALGSCSVDTSRALVVAGEMHTVADSSLSISVTETLADSDWNDTTESFVMAYTNSLGTQCYQSNDNPEVTFTVSPTEYSTFDFWVILDGAITPDDLSPSPAALGMWDLKAPDVTLLGNEADNLAVYGPRIMNCGAEIGNAQTFLVPAGSVPAEIGGLNGESCVLATASNPGSG